MITVRFIAEEGSRHKFLLRFRADGERLACQAAKRSVIRPERLVAADELKRPLRPCTRPPWSGPGRGVERARHDGIRIAAAGEAGVMFERAS